MAIAYVTEYDKLATDVNGNVIQAGQEPALAVQKVTFTTSTAIANGFNNSTRFVRIHSDTAAFIKFGLNPTAVTATDTPISATTAEFFGAIPAQKVAFVT